MDLNYLVIWSIIYFAHLSVKIILFWAKQVDLVKKISGKFLQKLENSIFNNAGRR